MQSVKKLAKGDLVTREWLASISDAIGELQRMAITGAQFPLTIAPGGTLMSAATNGKPLYKITEASGTFPAFDYVGQLVIGYDSSLTGHARYVTDEVDVDLINRCEFAPAAGYPYIYGTGNNITASDGTVDSGSCVIIPIGVGAVVEVDFLSDANDGGQLVGSFFAANSAEAP